MMNPLVLPRLLELALQAEMSSRILVFKLSEVDEAYTVNIVLI